MARLRFVLSFCAGRPGRGFPLPPLRALAWGRAHLIGGSGCCSSDAVSVGAGFVKHHTTALDQATDGFIHARKPINMRSARKMLLENILGVPFLEDLGRYFSHDLLEPRLELWPAPLKGALQEASVSFASPWLIVYRFGQQEHVFLIVR